MDSTYSNQSIEYNDSADDVLHKSSKSSLTRIILPIIFYTVFVVGVIGNVAVVHIMSKMVSKEKISDIFVINLAIADLIFLCILPFWATEFALGSNWIFGSWFCKIGSLSTMTSAYGGILFLCVMAADRLCVVVFYQRFKRHRTPKMAFITISLVWIVSSLISLIAFCFRDVHTDEVSGNSHCKWNWSEDAEAPHEHWYFIHLGLRVFVGFVIPLSFILVCYLIIICYLKRRKSTQKTLRSRQMRATKVIFVIIVMFIICWLPNEISLTIYILEDLGFLELSTHEAKIHHYIHISTTCLAWTHSCVNPFLYTFMREDVRIKLIEMLHKICPSMTESLSNERRLALSNRQCQLLETPRSQKSAQDSSKAQLVTSSTPRGSNGSRV